MVLWPEEVHKIYSSQFVVADTRACNHFSNEIFCSTFLTAEMRAYYILQVLSTGSTLSVSAYA